MYKNMQFAWVIWLILCFVATMVALGIVLTGPNLAYTAFAVILALVAFIFYGLTIAVDEEKEEVSWWFGPGVGKQTLNFQDIERVSAVQNSFSHGIGMKISQDGWCYSAAGFSAVEIVRKDGLKFRLGTNDQSGLVAALEKVLEKRS